jgi:catechol 2,3-dioxygenase
MLVRGLPFGIMRLQQLDHVAIAVRDVARSVGWYCDVLGFERRFEVWGEHPAMVCTGDTCVALFPADGSDPPPGPESIAMLHVAFRANRGAFEHAQRELRARDIGFDFQDHEVAHSIYFHDPDGHQLEITTYELG